MHLKTKESKNNWIVLVSSPTTTYQGFNHFIENLKKLQKIKFKAKTFSISNQELIALQNNWSNVQFITDPYDNY